jgi:hypothetical protein
MEFWQVRCKKSDISLPFGGIARVVVRFIMHSKMKAGMFLVI